MHARVTQFRILPGKLDDFRAAVQSLIPLLNRQSGFRNLIVLRTTDGPAPEATVISVWNSLSDLKASEKNLFLYQAISRVLEFCEGFPLIREHEVITGITGAASAASKKTN